MSTVGEGAWGLDFPPGPPEDIAEMFATAVVADAVRRHDADLAQWVETCRDWRRQYRRVFRGMTALAVSAPDASLGIAADGLRSVRTMLHVSAGRPVGEVDLSAAGPGGSALATGDVRGEAEPPARLEVPCGGALLSGDRLRRRLADWRREGVLEPGFAAAVERVIDHPEWLALPGFRVVVTGAAAELGPLRPLLHWGADVLAVDLPGRKRWEMVREYARRGAGRLRFPVSAGRPGADLAGQLPALADWIVTALSDGIRPVLGSYAAASGPAGVRVAAAADLLAEAVSRRRPDTALAQVGSPFDCYAVPHDVVADARARRARLGMPGAVQDWARVVSRTSIFRPNYRHEIADATGAHWGVADLLPPALGPNHALARRLPRWRAVLAQAAGQTVSHTVAPLIWTGPTRHAAWPANAYLGCTHFGIEVFAPDTARTLLAAKLVADLTQPPAPQPNPESLFTEGAFHGGLWRHPYEPRSVMTSAAVVGRFQRLLPW
ncbi:hypothetical protein BJY24_003239 [Nocardia transvalensis]|uniref:Uncharacterized protein n=1 Tax=Nocardia transvalensis TaxID=37333 RepID=A0A7W9UIN3_9NOCA|nr:hypothetical protein [Nocardia transvalensis]MBB5914372.1 hypothetical protein [Nocardia transvalensis]